MPDSSIEHAAARTRSIEWAAALFLLVITAAFIGIGIERALQPHGSSDLKLRDSELQYIRRGINPNDVALTLRISDNATPHLNAPHRDVLPLPEIGRPITVGLYPASTYAMIWPLGMIPFRIARVIFITLNIVSIGIIAACVFSLIRRDTTLPMAVAIAAGAIGGSGITRCLMIGQFGIVTSAALIFGILLIRRRHSGWAGVAFAVTLIKPTLSLPILIAIVCARPRGWRVALLTSCAILAAGWLLICWWTVTPPLVWFRQFLALGSAASLLGSWSSLPRWVAAVGGSAAMATAVSTGAMFAGSAVIGWAVALERYDRDRAVVLTMAAGAVVARLAIYHTSYDDVIIGLLVPAIPLIASRTYPIMQLLLLLVLFSTIALPVGLLGEHADSFRSRAWIYGYESWRVLIWAAGFVACVLAIRRPRGAEPVRNPEQDKSFSLDPI